MFIINSLCFRLSYLLGVSEKSLKLNYLDEYKKSDNLNLFKNYIDAPILRHLSLIRQYFYKNYLTYISNKNESSFSDLVKKSFNYLSSNGIPLLEIYRITCLSHFLNIIEKMVSIISYKVFIDLEIPEPEKMQVLLNFKCVSEKKLKEYCSDILRNCSFHDIIIPNGEKISVTLKYMFHSDLNLIKSVYSILGLLYDLDDSCFTTTFNYRKNLGEDLDKSAKIDGLLILNELKSNGLCSKDSQSSKDSQNSVKSSIMNYMEVDFVPECAKWLSLCKEIKNKNNFTLIDGSSIPKVICDYMLESLTISTTNINYISDNTSIYVSSKKNYLNLLHKKCNTSFEIGLLLSQVISKKIYEDKVEHIILVTNNKYLVDLYSVENISMSIFTFNREITLPSHKGVVYNLNDYSLEKDETLINLYILSSVSSMCIESISLENIKGSLNEGLSVFNGYLSLNIDILMSYLKKHIHSFILSVTDKYSELSFNGFSIKKEN